MQYQEYQDLFMYNNQDNDNSNNNPLLFSTMDAAQPFTYYQESPILIAPLVASHSIPEVFYHNENVSLSLDIKPCISVTEPTPIHQTALMDHFLNTTTNQQLLDQPLTILDELLQTTTTSDWLSWTPMRGNSPASITSNSFDDQRSYQSISPEPTAFNLSVGYPSPSLSEYTASKSHKNKKKKMSGNHICPHPGCGKQFTRPYNLTSHMRTHTADKPFACSQCGRKFARQHDRNRHEKLHWGIKPYACMHCKKPFARMDALNRHLRVENGCQQHIQHKIQQSFF